MDFTSTQLLTYDDICVDRIDLYEDAMGLYNEFIDVIDLLGELKVEPEEYLTKNLILKVRELN